MIGFEKSIQTMIFTQIGSLFLFRVDLLLFNLTTCTIIQIFPTVVLLNYGTRARACFSPIIISSTAIPTKSTLVARQKTKENRR